MLIISYKLLNIPVRQFIYFLDFHAIVKTGAHKNNITAWNSMLTHYVYFCSYLCSDKEVVVCEKKLGFFSLGWVAIGYGGLVQTQNPS